MALKSCYECRKQVSTVATSCPHCGAPLSEAAKRDAFMEQFIIDSGQAGKPRCPSCGLPSLTKLLISERIFTTGFLGTAGKTLKCGSCGVLS